MAQVESPTNEYFKRVTTVMVALDACYVALDEGSQAGFGVATDALTTESDNTGMTRAKGTTTATNTGGVTNDTMQTTKTFTCAENTTVTGFGVFDTATSGGHLWGWCTLNAAVPLEAATSDTFAATMRWTHKKD